MIGKSPKPDTRSNDPVRVYLRKMGGVSLLSREGEIEIAKRIEDGELTVSRIVLTAPLGTDYIDELIEEEQQRIEKALRSGKRPRRTKTLSGRSLEAIRDDARACGATLAECRNEQSKAKSKRKRAEAADAVFEAEDELIAIMEELDLTKRQIALISQRLQESWTELARCEKAIELVARDARLPVRDLRRSIRKVRRDLADSGQEVIRRTGIGEERWKEFDSRVRRELRKIRKIEQHTGLSRDQLREAAADPQARRGPGRDRQVRARRGQPPPRRLDRQEVHEPRSAIPRPHPGRQHRPDEGGREVRVPARLQVLHLRHLVDPSGDHPRDRRPGPHDPHPGPHDRDDQQARAHPAPAHPGARARPDAGRDRREDGDAGREGAPHPQESPRSPSRSRPRSARRKTPTSATSSKTAAPRRPPTRW